MTQPLICHFLIGLPASGKSTLARKLQKIIPNAAIISTDTARQKLYGNESTQGDWHKVEFEVLEQIKKAIASNQPVIYDATNVRQDWRMGILIKIEEKLKQIESPQVYWVAWHLQTSVDVCKEWNKKRDRQVPEETIEKYANYLLKDKPSGNEAFFEIYSISEAYNIKTNLKQKAEEGQLSEFDIQNLVKRIKSTENRISNYTLHKYSSQSDFDRLMHLISLIINYPGIGKLSVISPNTIKKIIGENICFNSEIDELCELMCKLKGNIYASQELIKKDLKWLHYNLIEIDSSELSKPLIDVEQGYKSNFSIEKNHAYSNFTAFERLIKVIRYIIHGNSIPISSKSIVKAENLRQLLNDDEVQRNRLKKNLRNRTSKLIKALVIEMIDNKILKETENPSPSKITSTATGKYIDNIVRYYGKINDIDFPVLKKYKIKPDTTMTEGYYFGTGIFSRNELNDIYDLLKSQSDKQYLSNELDYLIYQRFSQRLENSNILHEKHYYPVKAIGSKSIVDFNEDEANKKIFNQLEESIRNSELIQVEIPRQPWERQDYGIIEIYPLQIIFHGQAWYLGYEIFKSSDRAKDGLMTFERIDRIKQSKVLSYRSKNEQLKAFKQLTQLYQASAGIYLGNNVEDQKKYLNPKTRKSVEESFEIYATELSFKFLGETARRFSKKQMEMSIPLWLSNTDRDRVYSLNKIENQAPHHNRIKLTLPKWSVDDIYLIKWLVPWGNEIKVLKPQKLVDKIRQRGDGIQQLYESINLIVCEWDNAISKNRKIDGYISIKSSEISQHQTIKDWGNLKNNLIEVDLEKINQDTKIKESLKLIKSIYKNYKARKYLNILIYCSADKKIANSFAAKIYTYISQDKSFDALNISLCSR